MWEIQASLITIFKNWGVPRWIKVDNGRPFGDPQMELIPPIALWLIGLGIGVIWNRPATPQDNAKVERSQGVMARWTEYSKSLDVHELQERLWKKADFHNFDFPIRRKDGRTRQQIFPRLVHTGKEWNPKDFKIGRILIFLSKGNWERKVSASGQISIYGQRFYVGIKYKHQKVSIRLQAKENQWNIFDAGGILIEKRDSLFNTKSIWKLDFS